MVNFLTLSSLQLFSDTRSLNWSHRANYVAMIYISPSGAGLRPVAHRY